MIRFALELVRLLGSGVLYATDVRRLARAAWDDGWGVNDVILLSMLRNAATAEEAVEIVRAGWRSGHWTVSEKGRGGWPIQPATAAQSNIRVGMGTLCETCCEPRCTWAYRKNFLKNINSKRHAQDGLHIRLVANQCTRSSAKWSTEKARKHCSSHAPSLTKHPVSVVFCGPVENHAM